MGIRILMIAGLAVAVPLIGLVVYSCQVAGPTLSATIGQRGIQIEGRFLGEYELGFERVRINQTATGRLICELMGSTTADLHLTAGTNTPETMFRPGAAMQVRNGSGSCALANGQSYQVTVWGNNGWGNVRASSVTVQF